jgi:YesN/AraC family two-component response regulator
MAGVAAVVQDVRVLIVDDEDDMRALLRATLELADSHVLVADEAADGDDAVLKWRDIRPDW